MTEKSERSLVDVEPLPPLPVRTPLRTARLVDIELEASVLGLAIFDQKLASTLPLSADDFVSETHQRLWEIGQNLARRGKVLTVAQVAKRDQVIAEYIRNLAVLACGRDELDSRVATLKDATARRQLVEISNQLKADAGDIERPVEEIAADFIRWVSRNVAESSSRSKRQVAEAVTVALSKPAKVTSTGIGRFDTMLGGGLYAGKLYGIAARKKVGKSALSATISHNINRLGGRHLFVALEMSADEIEHRNMAREFEINSVNFLKGASDKLAARAADYATTVPDNTLYEHIPGASLDDLRRIVSRAIVRDHIDGFILDYWQLVQGKARNETEEFHLRNVAQWCADVSRKEGIWSIVNAQLNQDHNTRGGEGLKLACDMYLVLHREKDMDGAWLEMEESRYALYRDLGTPDMPGLFLNKNGPWFEEAPQTSSQPYSVPREEM